MHYSFGHALFCALKSDGGFADASFFPGNNAGVKTGMMHGPVFYIINAQLMLSRKNDAKNNALFVRFISCYFS